MSPAINSNTASINTQRQLDTADRSKSSKPESNLTSTQSSARKEDNAPKDIVSTSIGKNSNIADSKDSVKNLDQAMETMARAKTNIQTNSRIALSTQANLTPPDASALLQE
ncbi:MAG: hypothetical protein OCC45_11750 [Desulfotalea sp.]